MEGRDDGEAGAGAAERPEEVWVLRRGDERRGAVREDDVVPDGGVDEEAPETGVVAETAERGVAADADGGAGAVRETAGGEVSWVVTASGENGGTDARAPRVKSSDAMLPRRLPAPTHTMLVVLSSDTSWNSTMLMIMAPERP